jgi:two-component system phosphate regulon sensor histidine kinase PhoR
MPAATASLLRLRLPALVALVFVALWGLGAIAAVPAAAAAMLLAVLALLGSRASEPAPAAKLRDERAAELPADALLDRVLAGLPDPVIAINAAEEVVALNPPALALGPALMRGQPISRGVRVPEVLDALRRARASGGAQQASYLQRVPVERC